MIKIILSVVVIVMLFSGCVGIVDDSMTKGYSMEIEHKPVKKRTENVKNNKKI